MYDLYMDVMEMTNEEFLFILNNIKTEPTSEDDQDYLIENEISSSSEEEIGEEEIVSNTLINNTKIEEHYKYAMIKKIFLKDGRYYPYKKKPIGVVRALIRFRPNGRFWGKQKIRNSV
ncbi:uncharacterized protein LOC126897296 [Daktulosphaira vitifoliae]|uniref:uncharacterized protein LOC126897296 n=1 Tax=Daktulosphaira vitifoliae TaxID=58002 RepID=UPI0021AADBDC|nr:uncharacterized protein LOC126897296 [Daktulosphaira vitifoliae]